MRIPATRTLAGVWKANIPALAWGCSPLWAGAIILGLGGNSPQVTQIILFAAAVFLIQAVAEFANSYADREEDRIFFPANPLVTGELRARTAWTFFLAENVVVGALVIALIIVTLDYALVSAIIAGWIAGLAYSVPPLRLKATAAGPLLIAAGCTLLLVAGWLLVAPLDRFIIAFSVFFFVHSIGYGITHKFRKTTHAFSHDPKAQGSSRNLPVFDLKLSIRRGQILEALTAMGAFIMVPVFWSLGIFQAWFSIALLTLPLALTVAAIELRLRNPVGSGQKAMVFMTAAWASIMIVFLAYALSTIMHWGYAVLVCLAFLSGFALLVRSVYPFDSKALAAPWREL
ncbi:MAG: UbiA family prenyltransferase [Dehalococcoidia bacterium]|nr:UbiA family prenyltransferase [Dehalococcoidia bacterium]